MFENGFKFMDDQQTNMIETIEYHYSLILIRTQTGHTFGAFISAFPTWKNQKAFVGTQESFAFNFDNSHKLNIFKSTCKNKFYMMSDHNGLTIGSGGDGPAIMLNKDLFKGSTS